MRVVSQACGSHAPRLARNYSSPVLRQVSGDKNTRRKGFWLDQDNQRRFLDEVGKRLGIKQLTDWYRINRKEVSERGGVGLFNVFPNLRDALKAAYPNQAWDDGLFRENGRLPQNYLDVTVNQRQFLTEAGKQSGVVKMSDWYNVSRSKLEDIPGVAGLLNRFGSLENALRQLYPEYEWDSSLFVSKSKKSAEHWDNIANQRERVERIGKELGIKELSDWYKMTMKKVKNSGGGGVMKRYTSLEGLLRAVYPDFDWDLTKFVTAGRAQFGHWKDKDNLFKALDRAEEQLGITQVEDWYSVHMTDLWEVGFPYGISKLQLANLLSEKYPEHKWEKVHLLRGRFAQQKRLERAVVSLFEGREILTGVKKEAELIHPETKNYLELDIWIPSLNLAFEFQEEHHYRATEYAGQPTDVYTRLDKVKQQLAKQKGITLITVPFWWDGRQESLVATIHKARPELLKGMEATEPIPESMPPEFEKQPPTNVIEDIGEPTQACFLGRVATDPTNWWLFEKYDGVRGFWNPQKKQFYSRYGKPFPMPQEVIDAMPSDMFLDGELWFGRENYRESMKIANRAASSAIAWDQFKYMVFDIPTHTGTYEERYAALERYRAQHKSKFIEVAPKLVCEGMPHLERFFQDIMDQGGEGIILRDPACKYEHGRSHGYLKHKKYRDAEARVIEAVGVHEWKCELPNGVTFTAPAGTTEFAQKWQPKQGDIVTFKHRGYLLATKKPKFPTLFRVRHDLNWDTVVQNWEDKKFSVTPIIPLHRKKHKPKGYWANPSNVREFFCKFAEEKGFDPMDAHNWENLHTAELLQKGYAKPGSIRAALRETFPELTFQFKKRTPPPPPRRKAPSAKLLKPRPSVQSIPTAKPTPRDQTAVAPKAPKATSSQKDKQPGSRVKTLKKGKKVGSRSLNKGKAKKTTKPKKTAAKTGKEATKAAPKTKTKPKKMEREKTSKFGVYEEEEE